MGHSKDTRVVGVSSVKKGTKRPRKDLTAVDVKPIDKPKMPKMSKEEKTKQKDAKLSSLSRIAASNAINEFVEDERDNMAENSWNGSDDGSDNDANVYDRVQPPGPGSLTYVPLPPRSNAHEVLKKLEMATDQDKAAKTATQWLVTKYGNNANHYIRAASGSYSGVVIPLSKTETLQHKKKGEKRTFFLVSFDYHH
jgi:hypothetical protein